MAYVSEDFHVKRLNENGINIKTKFIVDGTIKERNSNGNNNESFSKGIICKKEYYVNNVLKHIENKFDSRIEYSYVIYRINYFKWQDQRTYFFQEKKRTVYSSQNTFLKENL